MCIRDSVRLVAEILDRRLHTDDVLRTVRLDKEIRDLIRFAVEFVPSAFNSQTTRVALLTGKAHEKLWNIVKNVLRERVPAEVFGKTEEKIDGCFACGYGTCLLYTSRCV